MTFSKIGRIVTALVASAALGLGMTACGGGTIGYMWVLGTSSSQSAALQTGEIGGFKIDDFTGNLTSILHEPFPTTGSNPQMLAVKSGGRFLYVVNSGTGEVGTPGTTGYVAGTGSSIAEFSIGGGGILTFQQTFSSQGTHPLYLSFDSTGNFLYVLDKYAPDYNATTNPNGSLTAFSVASDTGRLVLIQNTTVLNADGTPTNFFEVGPSPIMSKIGSSGCLFTITKNAVYPYVVSSSTGQLTLATTGPQSITNATGLTSINTSVGTSAASYVYFTDTSNQIFSYTAGTTACSLQTIASSQEANVVSNVIPVNSVTSSNGQFLYVINQAVPSTTTTQGSSISAFTISSQGVLQQLTADGTNNPYAVGSGPVCMVEDPSSQYFFTANSTDSTVTGKLWNSSRGTLADLNHGSTFSTVQTPTCLAVSGNI
jgi:6-phosphogluconolactonase (cycloisomerase 2 family)